MNMPMIKVANSYFLALGSATFCTENGVITYGVDLQRDTFRELASVDGDLISIESLNCKTMEELFIALDINNLVHSGAFFNTDISSIEKIKELTNTVKQLREENSLLKKKLKDIEKVFKQVKFDLMS